jgi:hypothetical protein
LVVVLLNLAEEVVGNHGFCPAMRAKI